MTADAHPQPLRSWPQLSGMLELLKPITWFAPMWALGCGVASAGVPLVDRWPFILTAVLLAGPLVCGTSQVVNDWFDRHVDAINEPGRPIPSGRVPGWWGLGLALAWTAVALVVGWSLGPWVFGAACLGIALAWAYSAPPFRLKKNGWYGNAAVGLCYEGLPWFTGAGVMAAGWPPGELVALALLYSAGAHGIMILNDFKAVDGDIEMGVRSIPVQLGVGRAARLACWIMAVPQVVVIAGLLAYQRPIHALITVGLLAAQVLCMRRLLTDPNRWAAWYNATGTTLYVLGMLVAALAARTLPLHGVQ